MSDFWYGVIATIGVEGILIVLIAIFFIGKLLINLYNGGNGNND